MNKEEQIACLKIERTKLRREIKKYHPDATGNRKDENKFLELITQLKDINKKIYFLQHPIEIRRKDQTTFKLLFSNDIEVSLKHGETIHLYQYLYEEGKTKKSIIIEFSPETIKSFQLNETANEFHDKLKSTDFLYQKTKFMILFKQNNLKKVFNSLIYSENFYIGSNEEVQALFREREKEINFSTWSNEYKRYTRKDGTSFQLKPYNGKKHIINGDFYYYVFCDEDESVKKIMYTELSPEEIFEIISGKSREFFINSFLSKKRVEQIFRRSLERGKY